VTQQASIADGLTINAGTGDVVLNATGHTDAQAKADGSAVAAAPSGGGGATANTVGAAVAINFAKPQTLATIGNGTLSAKNLSLTTGMTNAGGDMQNDYDAEATSGAGGGKNSVAGSVALNLVLSDSEASIASNATVNLSGDAPLSAASASNSVAKALPAKGGASGGAFGLGLSIAVNVVVDTTQ